MDGRTGDFRDAAVCLHMDELARGFAAIDREDSCIGGRLSMKTVSVEYKVTARSRSPLVISGHSVTVVAAGLNSKRGRDVPDDMRWAKHTDQSCEGHSREKAAWRYVRLDLDCTLEMFAEAVLVALV